MRASQDFIKRLELLHKAYEQEVAEKMKAGIIRRKDRKVYLRHPSTFVRWCCNDFELGIRKINK